MMSSKERHSIMKRQYKVLPYSQNTNLTHLVSTKFRDDNWYEFMRHDEIANKHREFRNIEFSDFQFCVFDENDNLMAFSKSIPTYWDGNENSLHEGYDAALEYAISNYESNGNGNWNTLLGTSVHVLKEYRNLGLSRFCLDVMKDICQKNKFANLIIPVRPVLKHKFPLIKFEDYIEWKDSDGRVFDPWLRTHLDMGAKIIGIALKSMVIKGSVEDWAKWTSMQFPSTGNYIVEGALVPVFIDCEENTGIYYDPNIWVLHAI